MPSLTDAYNWAIDTCNNPNVRYNQSYRNAGTDPQGYTCYDCSSFINHALLAGGWETPSYAPEHNPWYTGIMDGELVKAGFVQVDATGDILPGDIGLSSGHTEMAYSDGKNGVAVFMGAHGRDGGAIPSEHQVSIGNSSGNVNATMSFPRIYRYGGAPVEQGRSLYVIAAIAGNMDAESTLSPGTWESLTVRNWDSQYSNNTGGYGLCQWTNVGNSHGRLWNLYSWLTSSGYNADSGEGQVAYIPVEDYWTPRSQYPFSTLEEFLSSDSTDIDMLTGAWNVCWEGIPLQTSRYERSRYYYDVISSRMDDSSVTGWIAKNAFLSQTERDNNAIMLYRALRGKVGGDTTVNPGYDAGASNETDPELPNWYEYFLMALSGNSSGSSQKVKIRRKRK